jgi:hypothetical protein
MHQVAAPTLRGPPLHSSHPRIICIHQPKLTRTDQPGGMNKRCARIRRMKSCTQGSGTCRARMRPCSVTAGGAVHGSREDQEAGRSWVRLYHGQ